MGLLTQPLFGSVQNWIRAELETPAGSTVEFRFDRFGILFSDADFILPTNSDLGYSPELAVERFSDLVNRMPVDLGTGGDVAFSEADIDTTYFYRLLSPAQPYLSTELDATRRQERIESFSAMKAEALQLWEEMGNASVTGQLLKFRPSAAAPANWYDKSNSAGWQSRTFHITGTAPPAPGAELQWRLRPDDTRLAKILGVRPDQVQQMTFTDILRRAANVRRGEQPPPVQVATPRTMLIPAGPRLHTKTFTQPTELSLGDRILAKRQILEGAATKPATTSSDSTITFDACLVRVARPWLFWPLLTDTGWHLPGMSRGEVTRPGAAGGLSWLPTAILAIRNLKITAAWSTQDVEVSAQATNLGPFALTDKITDGSLSSPGLQIVGWLLERLPALPPNDAPPATEPRRYVVVTGDTLSRIARNLYGDPKRWPEIAAANHLQDPSRISVGQHLIIP